MREPSPPSVSNDRVDAVGEALERNAGALGEEPALVVVDGEKGRGVDHLEELGPREQRQALAGIEHEGHLRVGELLDVRAHAVAAVRRDDAEPDVVDIADAILVRRVHRPGMERGDLVVVEVGDDERLRGVRPGYRAHAVERDAQRRRFARDTARRRRRASP